MENDLVEGLAAGEASAYQTAYDRYAPALYTTALRMLDRSQDAEDAVQEVFTGLVRSRDRLTRMTNLKAYLFAALRHAAIHIRRRRRPGTVPLTDADCPVDGPRRETDMSDSAWDHVAALPVEQREVLALKIHGDLTFREIGDICNISPNTAASRYRYALEKLKRMLEKSRC